MRFFSGSALSRLSGLIRDVAMAAAFGGHVSVAAFFMAFRFANLARRLFGEGAMHAAFIPLFEEIRTHDSLRAGRFFARLSVRLGFYLLLGFAAIEALFAWILHYGQVSPGIAEILSLTARVLPALIFVCLYGINSALLNCHRQYFYPSVCPVILNLIWMLGCFVLWGRPDQMAALALWAVGGLVMMWALTLPPVFRVLGQLRGKERWSDLWVGEHDLGRLLRPLLMGIIGVGATQIGTALDPLFARVADPVGPAHLWYALRLRQAPTALIGFSLVGALLPPLSRAIQSGDRARAENQLLLAMRVAVTWMLPCTAALLSLGHLAVNFIYHHGAFSLFDVIRTTYCLWAYGWGILPSVLALQLAAACQASGAYRATARASAFAVGANLLLNTLFVLFFHWGSIAVAMATSLSSCFHLFLLVRTLQREGWEIFPLLLQLLAAARPVALITALAWGAVFVLNLSLVGGLGELFQTLPSHGWPQLTFFGGPALLFSAIIVIGYRLFGISLVKVDSSDTAEG